MTLQELYAMVDGDYNQAVKIMKMDKLIDRYVRKFENNGTDKSLAAARDSMDPTALFESAHGMKGVCSNLGFVKLAAGAEEITEEFRPGNARKLSDEEVKAKIDDLLKDFDKTVEGIRKYTEEA